MEIEDKHCCTTRHGSDSGYETKIAATVTKGKSMLKASKEEVVASTSAANNSNNVSNEEKKIDLFISELFPNTQKSIRYLTADLRKI